MNHQKETFETWNKVALLYQKKFMHLDLYDHTYDLICSNITTPGARILDIGCGPGNITNYLLAKRPDFEVLGIDMAPNMIALAKKNNPAARFAVMDCRKIDQLTEKYNGIVAGFCIPYLSAEETELLFAASYNLLENDGLLYVSFVEGSTEQSGFKTASSGDRTYFYYHELHTITACLRAQRFGAIEVYKVNYPKSAIEQELHTIVTARKNNIV